MGNVIGNEGCMFNKNVKNPQVCKNEPRTCKDQDFFFQESSTSPRYTCDEIACFGWCGQYNEVSDHNSKCCDCGGGKPVKDKDGNEPGVGECWDHSMCISPPNNECYQPEKAKCKKNKCHYPKTPPGNPCINGFCSKHGNCESKVISTIGYGGNDNNIIWAYTHGMKEGCTAVLYDGTWKDGQLAVIEYPNAVCDDKISKVIVPDNLLDRQHFAAVFINGEEYTDPVDVKLPDPCLKTNSCPTPKITNTGLGCALNDCIWMTGTDIGNSCTVAIYDGEWKVNGPLTELTSVQCSETELTFRVPEEILSQYSSINVVVLSNRKWTEPILFTF